MQLRRLFSLLAAVVLTLMCGCASTTANVHVAFGRQGVLTGSQRLAVLPFTDAKDDSGLEGIVRWETLDDSGKIVASILAEALLESGAYRVIERSRLQKILDEQGLSAAEFIEKRGTEDVGRILGADVIVVGGVGRFFQVDGAVWIGDVSFSARCIDVKTGELLWSVSPSVHMAGNVQDHARDVCREIATQIKRKMTSD